MKPDATAPRGTEASAEEQVALAWLKARIEDLSGQQPMWSRSAYTHRRTPHVAFANGAVKDECEHAAPWAGNVRDVAEATLHAARAYRREIDGPVLLTWRAEPTLEQGANGEPRIYCRLCFERDEWA